MLLQHHQPNEPSSSCSIYINFRREDFIALHSFEKGKCVTAQDVVEAIVADQFNESILRKTWSIIADTTSLNTGRRSGINTQLQSYIQTNFAHEVHVLECLFHITEVLLSRAIKHIEGAFFSPDTMQAGSVYNMIKSIDKPDMNNFAPYRFNIHITRKAKLHLETLILWCTKENEQNPSSGMMLLALHKLHLLCFMFHKERTVLFRYAR